MSAAPINVARRPFLNLRPVRRAAVAMWVVGGLLAVANGFLYWNALFGMEARRDRREELAAQIEADTRATREAEQRLRGLDLVAQNREATFLNDRIAERAFPWSGLFDDLAEVLPDEVRLLSLAPGNPDELRRRRSGELARGLVLMEMAGEARSGEALYELVDRMFQHPAFFDPYLPGERLADRGTLTFQITVLYRPQAAAAPPMAARLVEDETVAEGDAAPTAGEAPAGSPLARQPGVTTGRGRPEGPAAPAPRGAADVGGAVADQGVETSAGARDRTRDGASGPARSAPGAARPASPPRSAPGAARPASPPRSSPSAAPRSSSPAPRVGTVPLAPGASRPGGRR